ncbi:MAG: flagellar biosynthesis protein FlhA [candidate division Zixibacteria bacterium]|nr:flagellar biosynthesis protein FlhA [candidate division Zixibacteria bacterium]
MSRAQGFIGRMTSNADILLAVGVVGIIGVLIIPVAPGVLDFLLATNIAFSLIVLLATLYVTEPLQLSVFPGMLLIVTLFRLSLNVASTRLILGDAYAGEVITAFGGFVVKGNYVVGFIIFLILVIIQFVVITKGAGRISEVAARFTLDAMPGKQMAIDADLNAGLIGDDEARRRRTAIAKEADFYGAMDGASKFVRGDAVAGLIITAINIVGGLVVGVLQAGMSLSDAAMTYTLLSVGDGLVSQVPALLVSVSSGILVTRAAAESDLGADLRHQLTQRPRAIGVAATMLAVFGFVPGMPTLPFLGLGIIAGVGALLVTRLMKEREEEAEQKADYQEAPPPAQKPEEFLRLDVLEVEIGYGLIPIVDTASGGDLLDRVAVIRRQMAQDVGFVVPPVRIRDNVSLEPQTYVIKLRGVKIASGELMMNYVLAINPGGLNEDDIGGIPGTEPAYGLSARWIAPVSREMAEQKGYTVAEPAAVLATHLTEIIRSYAADILSRQDVQSLLDHLKQDYPVLVEETMSKVGAAGPVQRVLQNLLRERLPIKDLGTILETLNDYWSLTKDTDVLSEYARRSLKRSITNMYTDDNGSVMAFTLDPAIEKLLSESITQSPVGFQLALEPQTAEQLLNGVGRAIDTMVAQGYTPMALVAPNLRLLFRRFVEARYPSLVVLSYNDLLPSTTVEVTTSVGAQDPAPARPNPQPAPSPTTNGVTK